MRVWLVTDHYPPQHNGHAVAVAWWARALARHGIDVRVVAEAWRRDGDRAVWSHACYREVRLPVLPLVPAGHPLAGFRPNGRPIAALARERPDVIHLHGYGSSCAQVAAALPDVARVMSVHALPGGAGPVGWRPVRRIMQGRLARMARDCDVVIAPSSAAAARVGELSRRDDVRVVPTGVDESFHAVARGGLPSGDPRRPRVLYVGRRHRDKDFGTVTALAAAHPEAAWRAVGDGPDRTSTVASTGHLPLGEVAIAVRDADVLIAPSLRETQGLAAHEAITVGTPVVAPRGSAQADIVRDGVNGALYEPGDLDDAWRAVVRAAGVSRDDVLASATLWAPEPLVTTMVALYREAARAASTSCAM